MFRSIFIEYFVQLAIEAMQNIRTVVQLSKEEHFYDEYVKIVDSVAE